MRASKGMIDFAGILTLNDTRFWYPERYTFLMQEAYDPEDGSPVARPETSTGQTPVLHERTQVSVFIFVLTRNFN